MARATRGDMTEATILENLPGWTALVYIVIKEIIIPIYNARTKKIDKDGERKDKQESERAKFDRDFQLRLVENIEELTKTQVSMVEISRTQNERLRNLEDGQKEILKEVRKPKRMVK